MSGTIEEFDDDTDFALPTAHVPRAGSGGDGSSSGNAMGAMGGMDMSALQQMAAQIQGGSGGQMPMMPPGMGGMPEAGVSAPPHVELSAEEKKWTVVYPIYFDAKQHFEKGCRRVRYDQACMWPKSSAIEKAAQRLTLFHAHEPRKTHPRDWKNPGRVRIRLFDENGKTMNQKIPNKKALLRAIAEIIQDECGKPAPLETTKPKLAETRKPRKMASANAKSAPGASKTAQKGTNTQPSATPQPAHKNANARSRLRPRHRRHLRLQPEDRIRSATQPKGLVRYPDFSPNNEAGLLNADLGSMMGGLQGMGPLGAMMGQMGLGGDEDEEENEDNDGKDAAAGGKKAKDPMQQLNRKQRKRVVRIQGR